MAISTVLTQVQVLFILLGIGYYLSARHIVTDTGTVMFSDYALCTILCLRNPFSSGHFP